jgi:hypothetical protein
MKASNTGHRYWYQLGSWFNFHKQTVLAIQVVAICALPTLLAIYHGIDRHYLWSPDGEIIYVYNAFLLKLGLPNEFLGHLAYGMIFSLSKFYTLLEATGVLEIYSIDAMNDASAFNHAFQDLTEWARVHALLVTCAQGVVVMFLARALGGNNTIAFLAAFAYSSTHSFNTHAITIRPDMVSALYAYLSMLLAALAVRNAQHALKAHLYLGVAAFCALFSLYSRTPSLPLILAIPLFSLALVPWSRQNRNAEAVSIWFTTVIVVLAILSLVVAGLAIIESMGDRAIVYNSLIVFYVLVCVFVFCQIHGLPIRQFVTGVGTITVGIAASQYLLMIENHAINTIPIVNHIDFLTYSSTKAGLSIDLTVTPPKNLAVAGDGFDLVGKILGGLQRTLHVEFLDLCWTCRRIRAVYFLIIVSIAFLIVKGPREIAVRSAFLFLIALGFEMALRVYYYNQFYEMYVEGLLFIALTYNFSHIINCYEVKVRRYILTFFVLFCLLFWSFDIKRSLLAPSFATKWGTPCSMRVLTDRIAHQFDRFCTGKEVRTPVDFPTPWSSDDRTHLLAFPNPNYVGNKRANSTDVSK